MRSKCNKRKENGKLMKEEKDKKSSLFRFSRVTIRDPIIPELFFVSYLSLPSTKTANL